ncbi:MAG: M24 family metallopeptidase [Candidatus Lustribacter sp.]
MQTVHPVLKHGGLFSDWDLLPRPMFEDRYARIQAAIAAAGDDAWLIYGDAQRYGDVAYVSHFVPRLRSVLVLVPKSGKPDLLASIGSRDIPASKILTWFEEMRPYTRLPGEAVKLINDRGLTAARIGLIGTRASLPIAEWNAIAAGVPGVTWIERDAEYAALRATKDAAEDVALRRAADAVAAAMHEAEHALAAGRTVREATAQIDRAMRFAAAEDIRIMVAAGSAAGVALRPPDERILREGDTVLLYLQCEVQRYWSQASRTFVLGRASDAQAALTGHAEAALAAMIAHVRGGAPVAAVAGAAKAALGDELFAVAQEYGLGSGIGLDAHEPPKIALDSPETIPADGALSLHVVLHEDGDGAIAGCTVLVRNGVATRLGAAA